MTNSAEEEERSMMEVVRDYFASPEHISNANFIDCAERVSNRAIFWSAIGSIYGGGLGNQFRSLLCLVEV